METTTASPGQMYRVNVGADGKLVPVDVCAHYSIIVAKDPSGFYEASIYPYAVVGYGETAEEAFYDLCEVLAEWGLNMHGRDYPPHWYQTLWWEIENLFRRLK